MARRKSKTRTVYRTVRRGFRSRKGLLGGSLNSVIWGAIGGALAGFIPELPYLGKWSKPVVLGAGGYFLKKPALMTCAGYEVGKSLIGGMNNGYIANSIFEG